MKHALLAAGLVLVAGTAVGCGGGPPDDASQKDFCQNYEDFNAELTKLGADAEDADFVKALKDAGEKFEETGTPEDVSEDERAGYEVFLELIDKVEDDATQKDMDKLEKDLSKKERDQLDRFTTYVSDTCEPA
jgi:hypothetical protein